MVALGPGFNTTALDHDPPLSNPYYLSIYYEHCPRASSGGGHMEQNEGGQTNQAHDKVVCKTTLASH